MKGDRLVGHTTRLCNACADDKKSRCSYSMFVSRRFVGLIHRGLD